MCYTVCKMYWILGYKIDMPLEETCNQQRNSFAYSAVSSGEEQVFIMENKNTSVFSTLPCNLYSKKYTHIFVTCIFYKYFIGQEFYKILFTFL